MITRTTIKILYVGLVRVARRNIIRERNPKVLTVNRVFKMNQEKEYWENRYSTGGNSGWCSVGELKSWRWWIIDRHVSIKDKTVLDVGCGDLRFWKDKKHKDYTGLDISSVIIEKNRLLRPDWIFFRGDASSYKMIRGFDVVFCFEMLFHIMTESSYIKILKNLNRWTRRILFISCWSQRPEPFVHPHYQAHYQLDDYLHYMPNLELKQKYYIKKGLRALYVFTRKD